MCPLRSLNNSYWLDHYSFVFIKASTGQQSNDHNHVVMRRFSSTVALFSSHMTIYFLSLYWQMQKTVLQMYSILQRLMYSGISSLSSNSCVFFISVALHSQTNATMCTHSNRTLTWDQSKNVYLFLPAFGSSSSQSEAWYTVLSAHFDLVERKRTAMV